MDVMGGGEDSFAAAKAREAARQVQRGRHQAARQAEVQAKLAAAQVGGRVAVSGDRGMVGAQQCLRMELLHAEFHTGPAAVALQVSGCRRKCPAWPADLIAFCLTHPSGWFAGGRSGKDGAVQGAAWGGAHPDCQAAVGSGGRHDRCRAEPSSGGTCLIWLLCASLDAAHVLPACSGVVLQPVPLLQPVLL